MKIKIKLILLSFGILWGLVFAQSKTLQFDHFTTNNGLSQSTITCIYQDYQGFLWFGTYDGLNKFDGYDFTVYRNNPENTGTISDNFIWAIYEDKKKNLWIGTRNGLNRYDHELDNFEQIKFIPDSGLADGDYFIRSITGDSLGNLWLGISSGGLIYYDVASHVAIRYKNDPQNAESLGDNDINTLFLDSRSNLWIGTRSGELNIFQSQKQIFKRIRLLKDRVYSSPIMCFTEDVDSSVWVGTQGKGLFNVKYNPGSKTRITHLINNPTNENSISGNIILSLLKDRENKLWIGTENAGLNYYNLQTGSISSHLPNRDDNKSLSHASIWSLFQDKTGNIWIGTFANGINMLRRYNTFFRHYKNLSGSTATMFYKDSENRLWITTGGNGLNLFNESNEKIKTYTTKNFNLNSNVLTTLFEDSQNRLWIGSWMGGLNLFNRKTEKFSVFTMQSHQLGSDNVFGITEDNNGDLWLCTFPGGLTRFNPKTHKTEVFNTSNSGISDNNIHWIQKDYTGDLWVGGETGLNYFDLSNKTFAVYRYTEQDSTSLSKGNLLSLYLTKDSTLWIGTTGGLSRFKRATQTFERFTMENGLPSNAVKGIIEDSSGYLWITSNKGLSRFDYRNGTFKNYDVSDGLQGNEFYWHSIYKSIDGQIYIGGVNGFNAFYPQEVHNNPEAPAVLITDFRLFNKPVNINTKNSPLKKNISLTEQLLLNHDQSVITLEFTALNYISPGKNQYAYMLQGFDPGWNYVGTQRTATYTNLDAGDYIFKVKASNNDGAWNVQGTELKITVFPPLWLNWWAKVLYVFFTVAVAFLIMRHLISRERLKNELKLEHLQLEKMYELDQLKSRFFSNVSHEFRTPITLIMGPLEPIVSDNEIPSKIKKRLQLIYRNARRLLRMTDQLMDFHRVEAGEMLLELAQGDVIQFVRETAYSFKDYAAEHGVDFNVNTDKEKHLAWFDPDKLDKIIYNLLSNAFKFTPDDGNINMAVEIIDSNRENSNKSELANQSMRISVRDTGKGIAEDKIERIYQRYYQEEGNTVNKYLGSGVGLALVYELISLYRGKISVESKEGKGSTFTVELPLDIDFLEKQQLVRKFVRSDLDHPDLLNEISPEPAISLANHFVESKIQAKLDFEKTLPSVLIIEDDRETLVFIADDLSSRFRIFEAENGETGFEKAVEQIPDIIISDVIMPGISGTDLCLKLKKDIRTSHIPVILLTAKTSNEHRIQGLKYGADAYITKPFSLSVLNAHINNLVDVRKKLKERYSAEYFTSDIKIPEENLDDQFLNKVVNFIKTHLADKNLNAELIGNFIGMSRMQLYRKFRAISGQTVHEFIRNIRLKTAARLLLTKRGTVTQIAYEVGFNDLSYFALCFKRLFGISPSQYLDQQN